MKRKTITPLLSLLAMLLVVPSSLQAQNILVTTGEHAGFTRLVLQSAHPIDWHLAPSGRERTLRIAPADARIDLSRAFQRIPRTRLSNLERIGEGLLLHLGCDCPIRAWAENPRLVVLDIQSAPAGVHTPVTDATPALPLTLARGSGVRPLPGQTPVSELARMAGMALAREWSQGANPLASIDGGQGDSRHGPMPSPIAEHERQSIMHQLTAQIAGALGQGILEPSVDHASGSDMLLTTSTGGGAEIPPNLRVTSVLDRPDDDPALLDDDGTATCNTTSALAFAISAAPSSFNRALADLMRDWIGEFDQPGHAATTDLIALYLQHGFGAEARALIENSALPIEGRDLLLGFGDTLEGRQSNSRLRLAEQHECGGAVAMLAALAGAPAHHVNAQATDIASAFAQAPMVMRAVIGGDLVRALVDSGAIDAGRVVADTLRRTPDVTSEDMRVYDALLERARGNVTNATAHLARDPGDDAEALLLRLSMALETGEILPDAILLNAEAMASSQRTTALGTALMAAAIRLHVAADGAGRGLVLLDRLERWQSGASADAVLLGSLADTVWHGLARQASDRDFLDAILTRTDWNNPDFTAQTRFALAERMLDFGLADSAQPLLQPDETSAQRYLLAGLHLDGNRPGLALEVLASDPSDQAQELRARALHAQGNGAESGMILARLGAFDRAAQNAVLDRDWGRLADIGETRGSAQQLDLARALSSRPGEDRPSVASPASTARALPTDREDGTNAGLHSGPTPQDNGDVSLPSLGAGQFPEGPIHIMSDPLTPDAMRRGAMLLAESARLRETLGQLAGPTAPPAQPQP